ncbi:hypothetical protein ACFLY9_00135 [Patescibacteria group bacterium]
MENSLAAKKSKNVHEQLKDAEEQKKNANEKSGGARENIIRAIVYYSLPLLSIGVFIGILIFGTIPSIRGILNYNNEVKVKNEEVKELDKELGILQEIKDESVQTQSDLAIIDKIVPSNKTQVVKFVGEIEDLAGKHNLEISKYVSGEQIKQLEEKLEEESLSIAIINIPTTSEYIAMFDDVKDFLNELYNKDDFIIVGTLEMQGHKAREYLSGLQEEQGTNITVDVSLPQSSWTMEVTFVKYQFSKGFSQYISESAIPLNSEVDEETLKFIRKRYGD